VHGEADALPGVVCDRYGEIAVFQFSSAGAERWRESVVDAALAASGCRTAYERSDLDVRGLEGLAPRSGPVRGELRETTVEIVEHGEVRVDVAHGQKTGFYLDQRANRDRVRARRPRSQLLLLHRRLHVERARRRRALGARSTARIRARAGTRERR
jgi:23S rRNA G2069 N7-methylase RlmK/C1962 C5-methylase RlmI